MRTYGSNACACCIVHRIASRTRQPWGTCQWRMQARWCELTARMVHVRKGMCVGESFAMTAMSVCSASIGISPANRPTTVLTLTLSTRIATAPVTRMRASSFFFWFPFFISRAKRSASSFLHGSPHCTAVETQLTRTLSAEQCAGVKKAGGMRTHGRPPHVCQVSLRVCGVCFERTRGKRVRLQTLCPRAPPWGAKRRRFAPSAGTTATQKGFRKQLWGMMCEVRSKKQPSRRVAFCWFTEWCVDPYRFF